MSAAPLPGCKPSRGWGHQPTERGPGERSPTAAGQRELAPEHFAQAGERGVDRFGIQALVDAVQDAFEALEDVVF